MSPIVSGGVLCVSQDNSSNVTWGIQKIGHPCLAYPGSPSLPAIPHCPPGPPAAAALCPAAIYLMLLPDCWTEALWGQGQAQIWLNGRSIEWLDVGGVRTASSTVPHNCLLRQPFCTPGSSSCHLFIQLIRSTLVIHSSNKHL